VRLLDMFSPRKRITAAQIPDITLALAQALELQRDLFYAGAMYALGTQGVDTHRIPKAIEEGSDVDSALRALQLVAVVGFSWNYMDASLCLTFDEALMERMDNGHRQRIVSRREAFLDCEGDFPCLTKGLAIELHTLWGAPEPRAQIVNGVAAGASALIVMSQACAAAAAGDSKTESRLKQSVGAR